MKMKINGISVLNENYGWIFLWLGSAAVARKNNA
jgi:hypothetical protein